VHEVADACGEAAFTMRCPSTAQTGQGGDHTVWTAVLQRFGDPDDGVGVAWVTGE
jgi:hypothetical protein